MVSVMDLRHLPTPETVNVCGVFLFPLVDGSL